MSFWTDERVAALEDYWDRGFSCGLIAEQMGTTRNTIAGKAWRRQLPEREVLYTKPRPKRRGRAFEFRRRPAKIKRPPTPRHNGDYSWHLAQVAAGVAPRGSPPAPPPGHPSWRTFRRRISMDTALAAQVKLLRQSVPELKQAA